MINPFKRRKKPCFSIEQELAIRIIAEWVAWDVVNRAADPEHESEEDG